MFTLFRREAHLPDGVAGVVGQFGDGLLRDARLIGGEDLWHKLLTDLLGLIEEPFALAAELGEAGQVVVHSQIISRVSCLATGVGITLPEDDLRLALGIAFGIAWTHTSVSKQGVQMRSDLAAGTFVEVTDCGSNNFQYAVVVDQPEDTPPPNDHDAFVWVRYDNGCVVPIREYYVSALTSDQVAAKLNEHVRSARS